MQAREPRQRSEQLDSVQADIAELTERVDAVVEDDM